MNQQKVLNFKFDNSYNEKDFILDSSNEKALLFFNKFPDWENKLINLVGSEKSGKTFLLKILNKKNDLDSWISFHNEHLIYTARIFYFFNLVISFYIFI